MNITPLQIQPLAHGQGTRVRAKSSFSGSVNEMDLPVSAERIQAWLADHTLIQEAFPELTADQREFLLTGTVPGEWEAAFPGDEESAGSEFAP